MEFVMNGTQREPWIASLLDERHSEVRTASGQLAKAIHPGEMEPRILRTRDVLALLDGEVVEKCMYADEAAGVVIQYCPDPKNYDLFPHRARVGKVRIVPAWEVPSRAA